MALMLNVVPDSREERLLHMGAAHIYARFLTSTGKKNTSTGKKLVSEEERLDMARQAFKGAAALVLADREERKGGGIL